MLEKLKLVEARYLEMAERAAQPDFYNDPKAASQLLKEQRQLEPIITAYRSYRRTQAEQEDLRAMLSEGLEPEMKALCQEEFSENKKKLEALEQELKILLLPRDPNDDKSVIMEIRGGAGGEEAALFAHSLYRMYTMYAEAKHWTVTLLNYNETELGGVKEADFEIQGAGAYSRLKFESGVHRVQRVPETESGGRVHTSTATVAVLPEMEQAEVDIRPEDIEMQVYRSSGAGGQHINKTSSAVRLIHKPSGIVVACQEERSQVQNREKCMQMLASKLYQIEQERIESAVTSERRSQVGTGMRNERIRTYNFPQGRVTDHRIGLTLYKIDSIMDGALDELIDAGLSIRGKNGGVYDRFRNRLMFPIIDIRGNVIGFGGRVMDDSTPKYLNSPETLIFNKRKNLFALNVARKSKQGRIILTEGYMDAIALHQYGFDCAVASLGTSLTEEHANILAKYTNQVILTYDGDEAGQNATRRAMFEAVVPYWEAEDGKLRKLKLLPVELGFGKKRSVGGWPAPDAHSGILERLAEMSLPYGTKIEIGSDGTGTVLL